VKKTCTWLAISLCGPILVVPGAQAQAPGAKPSPAPTYTITLRGRDACVTPHTRMRARADGGIIDVQMSTPSIMTVTMTGTPAADSYLGCTSTATQTFHLVQEFDIACSDPSVQRVSLILDSSLVGYVRSTRKAAACVRLASVSVAPESWEGDRLTLAHPSHCVSGTQAQLCNQHLPPLNGFPMPVGRFTLIADFVLDTTASGVCNAHAVADFSPDTTLPAEWVRMRDPFQGVSKKSFGFTFSITAAPPSTEPSVSAMSAGRRASRGAVTRPAAPLTDDKTRKTSF
jgi:hypothetical protein